MFCPQILLREHGKLGKEYGNWVTKGQGKKKRGINGRIFKEKH